MERRGRAMGLMCNKLHEGAFREALFFSSTHTIFRNNRHAHVSYETHTYKSELCVTHNLIHIYERSNTSRLYQ